MYGWDVQVHNPGWLNSPSGPLRRDRLTYQVEYGPYEEEAVTWIIVLAVLGAIFTCGLSLLLLLAAKRESESSWATVRLMDGERTHHMRVHLEDHTARHTLNVALGTLRAGSAVA